MGLIIKNMVSNMSYDIIKLYIKVLVYNIKVRSVYVSSSLFGPYYTIRLSYNIDAHLWPNE